MATASQARSMTIDDFIRQVDRVKRAEAGTEAGSFDGATEHPSGTVDDRTRPGVEGERSTENKEDVEEAQGDISVDSTPQAKAASIIRRMERMGKRAGEAVSVPGSAASDQIQIGTKKAPTGDDPASETDSAKAGKTDPGSTHPARTDNDDLDGHKYASLGLRAGMRVMEKLASQIIRTIAADVDAPAQKRASYETSTPVASYGQGYQLAALAAGTMDKQAAELMVEDGYVEIIKLAHDDSDATIAFLEGRIAAIENIKRAEGDMPPVPMDAMSGEPAGAGMMPPPGGDAGHESHQGAPGEEEMMSALGGNTEGEDAGAEVGEGAGDEGAGDGDGDDKAQQIASLMQELGLTVDDIAAASGHDHDAATAEAAPKMGSARSSAKSRVATEKAASIEYLVELLSRSRN